MEGAGTERQLRKKGLKGREEGREDGRKENLRRDRGRHGETATEARAGDRWTTLTSVLRRKNRTEGPSWPSALGLETACLGCLLAL